MSRRTGEWIASYQPKLGPRESLLSQVDGWWVRNAFGLAAHLGTVTVTDERILFTIAGSRFPLSLAFKHGRLLREIHRAEVKVVRVEMYWNQLTVLPKRPIVEIVHGKASVTRIRVPNNEELARVLSGRDASNLTIRRPLE